MIEITAPKARLLVASKDNTTAVFRFEGLMKGMGTSLGTTLSRILLTYIPGYAAQCYCLDVDGESVGKFDSIKSCIENTLDLSKKITAIRLAVDDVEDETKSNLTFTLVTDPEEHKDIITAGDLKVSESNMRGRVHILNPDLVLLTRGGSSENPSNIDLRIKCGYNIYFSSSRETNKISARERKYMTVNSIYSPVIKAHHTVTEGNNRLLENLILTIKTTGAVTPSEALEMACNLLAVHAQLLSTVGTKFPLKRKTDFSSVETANLKAEVFGDVVPEEDKQPIEEAGFSSVVYNYLKMKGIHTMGELSKIDQDELLEVMLNNQSGVYSNDNGNTIKSDRSYIIQELEKIGFKKISDKG